MQGRHEFKINNGALVQNTKIWVIRGAKLKTFLKNPQLLKDFLEFRDSPGVQRVPRVQPLTPLGKWEFRSYQIFDR